jgi:hypothetical protein
MPTIARWSTVEKKIRSGDLLLWSGSGVLSASWWIARASCSQYTHAAMASVDSDGVDVVEMTFNGGRCWDLYDQVKRWPMQWSWRPIRWEFSREYDGEAAAAVARQIARQGYGWSGVLRVALKYAPGLREWIGIGDEGDIRPSAEKLEETFNKPMFCSEMVHTAAHLGGGILPVQGLSRRFVAPADVAHSILWDSEKGAVLIP